MKIVLFSQFKSSVLGLSPSWEMVGVEVSSTKTRRSSNAFKIWLRTTHDFSYKNIYYKVKNPE